LDVSTQPFFHQLLISTFSASLGARHEKDLERGIGKNYGPHVASFGDETGRLAKCPLSLEQGIAHRRMSRHLGRRGRDAFGPDRGIDPRTGEENRAALELNRKAAGHGTERRTVREVDPLPLRNQCDEPVKDTTIQSMEAERLGNEDRDRPLARGGGTIDRDDGRRGWTQRRFAYALRQMPAKTSKYSGNVLATQPGSWMRTGTPASAISEKHIAMR